MCGGCVAVVDASPAVHQLRCCVQPHRFGRAAISIRNHLCKCRIYAKEYADESSGRSHDKHSCYQLIRYSVITLENSLEKLHGSTQTTQL
ncbi:hypothetical protein GEV33_008431 [Tenebrio molitor]|uniref:Uncharacterized protein n=1 Tax=Tenebrio molitor TaxID=7067 RepID=A0A8J6LA51_TENMO|nr:hypothetical protein GEV33_008431 [Tenebrio molitor]